MTDLIERVVLDALRLANRSRPAERQIPEDLDASLFGPGGSLDSLGLVAFVMDVEDGLRDTGHEVSLSDQSALSASRSPFRTGRTLVDYISGRLSSSA